MKTIALTIAFLFTFIQSQSLFAQTRKPASLGREEYIEVEKNVNLHVIDLGEGQPVVLIKDGRSTMRCTNINTNTWWKKGSGLSGFRSAASENRTDLMENMTSLLSPTTLRWFWKN
jgi:hypothetical protein